MESEKLKILAVDDVYDNLISLKALILEAFPIADIVFALSGAEAIYMAKTIRPDMILLDVVMPEMDGFEVCRRLKSDETLKNIPVVFVTALKGDKESRIKALEVGAEAFLAKPIDESELVAQVRAMAKINEANKMRQLQEAELTNLVAEKTVQLEFNNVANLNLLEDLEKEIAARRITENKLVRSEARLRRAELASKSGNWEFDPDTKQFLLSDGAAFVLGFANADVSYDAFVSLIDESYRPEFELSLSKLCEQNTPFNLEVRMSVLSASEIIDVRIFAIKEHDEHAVFGVLRDITEHKRARQEILRSEAEFRSVWESSSNALRLTDENGVIIRANKAYCDLFEVDENEAVGKLMSDFYHQDNEIHELQKYKLKFANNQLDKNKEKEIILWNNKKKWVEISKTYIAPNDETKLLLTIFNEITTRKEAELTLALSEAKYRELMDNSPEGITIYVDGKIAYINKEAMNVMRAKDKSELLGRSLFEFINPEDIPLIIERMQFVAMTPLNMSLPAVEEKYLRLDGTEVYVEIKVMPILFDGQPAVQISGHDITEKKIAREEIEKNRKELKAIYDNAPVMMCLVNNNAEILFANNALNTFVDEPGNLLGLNNAFGNVIDCINSFTNPEGCGHSNACKNCILRHTVETTFNAGFEHRDIDFQTIVLRHGVQKKVSLLASTSLIDDGGEKRLLLCMTDITARKEAENALLQSETLLRTFIDNIPFGVWARDINDKVIIQNSKLVENFGNIIETDVKHYSKKDKQTAKKWDATNRRAYAGEIVNEEVVYTVNGKPAPFQNIVFPIRSENNTFGIAGINIDISERLKAQKELIDYQHQLKDFASHLQTVREEERINLAREIHDDLGQILVAIKFDLGMLGIKSKKFVKEEAAADFQTQFKRLEGFVNNTIKSARRIMTDLRPELLDMVGLVEAFNEHIKAFNERQIIHCEFVNKTTTVEIAPEKSIALFRILQESLNNAVKHSQASLIEVELGCDNNITYLQITDNGVGFDLSMKKRNDSYGLTGMKERAYLLEGKVDIWSEPGKGVKIRVEVPDSLDA